MKECPKDKILNPKTNRCVNIKGKIGKNLTKDKNQLNISNENNSCYIDSLLVALFHFKNRVIYNMFFKNKLENKYALRIQEELFYIYKYINNKDDIENKQCNMIRKYLEKYYRELLKINENNRIFFNNRDNWITQQIDVFELITYLDKIFDFKNNVHVKDGNNKYKRNVIYEVSSLYLMGKSKLDISSIIPNRIDTYNFDKKNYFKNSKGKLVTHYEKEYNILKTNGVLLVEIYRSIGGENKLTTKIIYPNTIKIEGDKKALKLRSIILHKGDTVESGHYTALLKRNGKTYEYDDILETKVQEITEEYEKKMRKNIVCLVYSR
jgi:ubiquitin C-terminal hydrolase